MCGRFFALLVHAQPEPLESLKMALKDLSIETYSVPTLEEASRLIRQTEPHLVFTDVFLPDGSWVDVLIHAEKADIPVNVIVVGASKDTRLYISALERGAYDFVLPPFEREALDFVVESAGQDARHRRKAWARTFVA